MVLWFDYCFLRFPLVALFLFDYTLFYLDFICITFIFLIFNLLHFVL